MLHPLDRPIWSALTTRQSVLAEINGPARRYPRTMTPFADLEDFSPASWAALAAMMEPDEHAALFTPEPIAPPEPFRVLAARTAEQMTGTPSVPPEPWPELATLGPADVPEMAALVELTRPGPFGPRTHELGTFLGIRIDGRLAAMTGERMRPGAYTELTAVCVHPDFRGRGFAQVLMAAVAQRILARSEIPFLHVFSDNISAIALYHRLGLTIRRQLHVTVVGKGD